MMSRPLIEARDLRKSFQSRDGTLRVLNGVGLSVDKGETLALVGESGSGKTTLARAITMLVPPDGGSVRFDGMEITRLKRRELKPFRRRVQMVFQDPYGSLNPRLPVGRIIAEPLVIHGRGTRDERHKSVARLVEAVGLGSDDLARYPHEFSGGQRQRIAIARALALGPDLIVADEPVSALDVSIQSQILNLMADLRETRGMAYLFISHDLGVVRHIADRVAVMYLGTIVEEAPAANLFAVPRHPYTRALIAATPVVGRGKRKPGRAIIGEPPSPLSPPKGCPFHPRCPMAVAMCRGKVPVLEPVHGLPSQSAACHFKDQPAPAGNNPWTDLVAETKRGEP